MLIKVWLNHDMSSIASFFKPSDWVCPVAMRSGTWLPSQSCAQACVSEFLFYLLILSVLCLMVCTLPGYLIPISLVEILRWRLFTYSIININDDLHSPEVKHIQSSTQILADKSGCIILSIKTFKSAAQCLVCTCVRSPQVNHDVLWVHNCSRNESCDCS